MTYEFGFLFLGQLGHVPVGVLVDHAFEGRSFGLEKLQKNVTVLLIDAFVDFDDELFD